MSTQSTEQRQGQSIERLHTRITVLEEEINTLKQYRDLQDQQIAKTNGILEQYQQLTLKLQDRVAALEGKG